MRVEKSGDGLVVQLPQAVVDALALVPGDELEVVTAQGRTLQVARADRRAAALARMAQRGLEIPADYKFDREEANAR
jgi:antitoxin MazE